MNRRFQEDGYLYFRRILDRREVERVKREFVHILQEQGVVKPGCEEPVWSWLGLEHIDDNPLYRLKSYDDIMESETTLGLLERLFGGPVFRYRNTDIRFALPNDERHLTPPHQDHFFIRQTDAFRTAWLPLMFIGGGAGELAIAKRSHCMGLLEHVEHETAYSYIHFPRQEATWRSAGAHRGSLANGRIRSRDIVLFHSMAVHRALPNRSDRIRLSLDARFQSSSIPRTWQSHKTILELRQCRSIAMEQGASEPVFEALLIEMMKRGLEAEAGVVRALMEEL